MHRIYASILYIMYIHVKNFSSLNTQILTVESIILYLNKILIYYLLILILNTKNILTQLFPSG